MASVKDFEAAIGFTDADIAANRRGQLSEAQMAARQQARRPRTLGCLAACLVVGLVAVVALIALALNAGPLTAPTGEVQLRTVVMLALPALIGLAAALLGALTLGAVLFPPEPALSQTTGLLVPGSPSPDKDRYEVRLNGVWYALPKAAYDLIDPTVHYTLYRAVYADGRFAWIRDGGNARIIAMEPVHRGEPVDVRPTPEAVQRQLQDLFDFTPADLRINRTLRLSPDQIEALRFTARWSIALSAAAALAIAVAVSQLTRSTGYALLAFLLIFALGTWLARRRKRQRAALLSRGVAMARGPASVRLEHRSDRRGVTLTHVEVNGKTFHVSEAAYAVFQTGGVYEVYYIRELDNRIVSAAQIG